LRAELEEVKRERDMYKKALLRLLPIPEPPTAEELAEEMAEAERNGLTMTDLIQQIKARHGLAT
jgi:hypothetical protein